MEGNCRHRRRYGELQVGLNVEPSARRLPRTAPSQTPARQLPSECHQERESTLSLSRLRTIKCEPPNALVQLQARYHHCGEAASKKCLSAATFVRWWPVLARSRSGPFAAALRVLH